MTDDQPEIPTPEEIEDQQPDPVRIDTETGEVIDGSAEEITPEEAKALIPAEDLAVNALEPTDVFRAMDRNDELQILDEIQGRALTTWVYSFEQSGQLVTDLSVSGVNEGVRIMNERGGKQIGISETPPLVEMTEKDGQTYYQIMVYAHDQSRPGAGRWGTALEPEEMKLRGGKTRWDKFALAKALNKAQRNALKTMIPDEVRQMIIKQYLGTEHEEKLKPLEVAGGGTVQIESGPLLDDDRAKALREEITEGYRALRELNKLKFPPAMKTEYLRKAESDGHDRMEALRDTVQDWIEEERKEAEDADASR